MRRKPLQIIVAENLAYFMARDDCLYDTANSLGKAVGISPNTVRNLLNPKKRPVTAEKPDGYPTLDTLELLAKKLPKCETWMLLHPDIQRALRALTVYASVEADVKAQSREPEEQTVEGEQGEAHEAQRQRA